MVGIPSYLLYIEGFPATQSTCHRQKTLSRGIFSPQKTAVVKMSTKEKCKILSPKENHLCKPICIPHLFPMLCGKLCGQCGKLRSINPNSPVFSNLEVSFPLYNGVHNSEICQNFGRYVAVVTARFILHFPAKS